MKGKKCQVLTFDEFREDTGCINIKLAKKMGVSKPAITQRVKREERLKTWGFLYFGNGKYRSIVLGEEFTLDGDE